MTMLKIFLIEDNEGDVLLISDALEELNIPLQISYAKDGHEAVEFLESCLCVNDNNIPDLVLLDINLPKKNGQEVLQFIKSSNGLKQIPVIMLTTSSSETDILESYKNHANSYISKPMGPESYQDILQKIESFWFSLVKLPSRV
ncbi:response regulator [Cyclobacterium sp. GBPx2]|uniref:Response regulator n=2 Tax=Cyclobacterium plantarum TaxID=2716263 RepID=A0ABX0HHX3_9BACT|nr:response regulator [Cyclobacterium plantarum]